MGEQNLDNFKKRQHVRFQPDPLDVAFIGKKVDGEFSPELSAMILQEAPMGGCGLAMRITEEFQVGDECVLKLGKLDAYNAVVRWRKQVDEDLLKVGFQFLE